MKISHRSDLEEKFTNPGFLPQKNLVDTTTHIFRNLSEFIGIYRNLSEFCHREMADYSLRLGGILPGTSGTDQAGQFERANERTSERTSEWPSTYV